MTPTRSRAPYVIAIDGPAGAGKSTVAKGVAKKMKLAHLDTGAMYRSVAARALLDDEDPTDEKAMAHVARKIDIVFSPEGMLVDGEFAGRNLRTQAVNAIVSVVSAHPAVRKEMVRRQRKILGGGNIVAEGRDLGTVVCPRARVKIFLTASVAERARRRHAEMEASGMTVALATIKKEIARRDAQDTSREHSPLAPAADAVILDSTGKTARQVIDEIAAIALERRDPPVAPRTRARV